MEVQPLLLTNSDKGVREHHQLYISHVFFCCTSKVNIKASCQKKRGLKYLKNLMQVTPRV